MKHLFYLFFLVTTIVACNKKNTNTPQNNPIIGTWQFKKMYQTEGTIKVNGVENGTFHGNSSNEIGTLELKSDYTTVSNIGYDYEETSISNGFTTNHKSNVAQQIDYSYFTYSSGNKKITIMNGDVSGTFDIIKLEEKEFIIKKYSQYEIDQLGKITSVSFYTTFEFTKK